MIEIESVKEITQSHTTAVDIRNLTNDASINKEETSSMPKSYEELKNQLQNRFDEPDISSENELEIRIEDKEKRIED